ncbi:MAG: regulatory protein RecX [Bifidobacterium pseudocatenulatum]
MTYHGVERFLEQQGLQPVLSEAGGSALSSGRRLQDGRIESGCGQVLCNDEEDTPKRTRHARHAGRVVAGVSRTPDDPNDLDACREAALRLLDAAPRPSGAMRERLVGKGYAPEVVDDVIARLIRVRLIDDEAYAQSAVRYCASRLMGYRGAVMELKRKGVDRQLAQRVCDEAESQGVFAEAAWELGRRTARKTAGLDVEVRKRRFWSAGGRKGHNPEVLRKIAQELFV